MTDNIAFAFSMATLGQIALCLVILATRVRTSQAYTPLILFFACNAIVAAMPTIWTLFPDWRIQYVSLLPPAYLLLGPSLWFYVQGLTAETEWQISFAKKIHFVPFILGLIASGMILALPLDVSHAMFIGTVLDQMLISEDGKLLFPGYLAFYLFTLVLLWSLQTGVYVIKTFRHLPRYHRRLKEVFASIEDRELRWVTGVLIVIGLIWFLIFGDVLLENLLDRELLSIRTMSFLEWALVFVIAIWGVRQKPGFEGHFKTAEEAVSASPTKSAETKYRRSALKAEQAQRIVKKIKDSMEGSALYLDPNLSLQTLAKHIGVSTNHISQTLNETMNTTFFDYVNKHRIEAAKPLVLKDDETILSIAYAVGFNARSSFYRAFKHHTGQTPSEFKMSHL